LFASSLHGGAPQPQEKIDAEAVQRIRTEALEHSHVTELAATLTDVYGPRLTGSPNLKNAENWAADTLRGWGIDDARLEPWGPFGRGWSLTAVEASMIAPEFAPLIAYPKAWSAGTNGPVRADLVYLDAASEADLEKFRGKLKGKIVLFAPPRALQPNFEPPPQRTSDEDLQKLENAKLSDQKPFQLTPQQRATNAVNQKKWELIYSEDPAVVLEPGLKDAGTVYVTAATIPQSIKTADGRGMRPWDVSKPKVIPQLVVSAEQYNRMVRLATRKIPLQAVVNISVRYSEDDPMSANVIADIPGTDLRKETVMLGGCIDSWHTGTGATDNAAGAAVAMEVMRIFKSLGIRPRRSIRIGLWSGEEQGRLGSSAYAAKHLGRVIDGNLEKQPAYDHFDVYFNLDYGTGRIRGIYLQGNEAVRPIFHAWLAPLADLGASTTTIGSVGADHESFDEIGLPGFQFLRDFMEFSTRAAHTNMDVYDHILPDDLKQSAAVTAALVYDAAMRDEKLPGKPAPSPH
jgi:hypothetical protein